MNKDDWPITDEKGLDMVKCKKEIDKDDFRKLIPNIIQKEKKICRVTWKQEERTNRKL